MVVTRRAVLKGIGATTATALVAGCAPTPGKPTLAPVQVSRERVLKTIVGLRPYRPQGFVVRSERIGAQTIVHNYGHGGCGVTLSWGTAQLAVEQVLRTGEKQIAVLGCGAVGLATARLLQQRGLQATIYARDLPPHTTSDIAGARWYPFDVFDSAVATPEFLATLWRVSRIAYRVFRSMLGDEYGVYARPTYACRDAAFPKESLLNFDSPVHDLLPGLRDLEPGERPFSFPIVRMFESLMIEPAIYLPAVMRDHARAGGRIVVAELKSLGDVAALPERTVVNCTGMGAATLFNDTTLYPIKGQLTILKPQPEVDYLALPPNLYMFPRNDGILLGGTFEHHVSTLEPDLAAERRIMDAHAKFFASLAR
jgi:D-amino-acid oxidase